MVTLAQVDTDKWHFPPSFKNKLVAARLLEARYIALGRRSLAKLDSFGGKFRRYICGVLSTWVRREIIEP